MAPKQITTLIRPLESIVLDKLTIGTSMQHINVRLMPMWEAHNFKQNKELMNLHSPFSSIGRFMDDLTEVDDYTTSNTSRLSTNASSPSFALYKIARISPLVLTYYRLCLGNENYNVSLHFSEIIITDDSSFYSFGKRVFDIYVQVLQNPYVNERLAVKNFNIKEAAGRSGKPIIKTIVVHVSRL
ncbi:hypothetical protein ARALYDRAFT_892750 [Arabidopsis lyrata subsp. lyrata]|uniref:Malectin domain-containing protein n=1 Tax=Arabidopsis lyrata subsp. lyrata TaxID=81972 RepID=D7KQ17_ARALL|nr:hypothetical protein ARALYDRAFT_892750 [Arabidopsis lyrata subsp. lyrata]